MKKATIELIEKRFKKEFDDISCKIYSNKCHMKSLVEEQKDLKNTRKGLFEILRMIRNK